MTTAGYTYTRFSFIYSPKSPGKQEKKVNPHRLSWNHTHTYTLFLSSFHHRQFLSPELLLPFFLCAASPLLYATNKACSNKPWLFLASPSHPLHPSARVVDFFFAFLASAFPFIVLLICMRGDEQGHMNWGDMMEYYMEMSCFVYVVSPHTCTLGKADTRSSWLESSVPLLSSKLHRRPTRFHLPLCSVQNLLVSADIQFSRLVIFSGCVALALLLPIPMFWWWWAEKLKCKQDNEREKPGWV